ncbi:MAG: response regulator [Oligoflexus sp.]
MNATRQFDPLLEVEQSLIQLFPGSFPLLLKYGETQLRSGKIKEGLGTLQQACLIDERAKRVVDSITEKHVNVKINTSSPFPAQQNILGIETCVLVDPDTAVLSALKKLLAQAGVPQIETFDKGEEAWNWLCNNPEPGLILQEWRIPDLPGPILLQRTRQHGFINTPINMISSVIKPEESHLLREFGVTDVIAKPFAPQSFFKSLVWTLQQHVCPTEQNSLQQKIMRLLKNEQIVEAERLKATFMADPRIRASCKKAVEATFAYHYGKYRESRNLAIEALKLQGDSLCLLNLIGKCLLKLGDSTAAMKVFEKAHSISKMNIETLCHLAIAQNDSGKRDESEATLQRAKGLDSKSQLIGETECQIALLNEDVSKSRRLMEELSSVQNVISYMNNRAVSLTRSGRFDDGIKLYQRTIEALPPKLSDTKDLVLYNLGLAYAKYGELQSAKQHLVEIASRSESKVLRKAESLLKRVKVAIEDNSPLSFYEAEDIDCGLPSPQESMLVETVTDGAQRGLCLHGIYRLQQDEHAKWNDLFESQPKFRDKRNNPSALRMEGFNNGN